MTREEAIRIIETVFQDEYVYKYYDSITHQALDIAIEALQAEPNKAVPPSLADVYKWERDIALSQLEEYGIGFGEKKRNDLVEVVRCKDCEYNLGETRSGRSILCNYCSHGVLIERNNEWYCADGERREP